MNKKKNFISAIVCQVVTLIYGLVVPRLIVITFGSSVNGLISSISQFLSFVSLLEGGLGAVVLAELYKPIEENDNIKIAKIIKSCQKLFFGIGIIYIVFTIILAFIYPIFVSQEFDYFYVFSLTLILSLGTVSQYMFSITNRLFLQANQKIYIVNIVSSITLLINVFLAVLCIAVYPEVHVLKLSASLMFFVQPFIFSRFVDKKYRFFKTQNNEETYKISNRWSGFGQNLAHFINMNTDIIVVTIFLGLTNVSIYSIYLLAINAIRNMISMINNSYQSAFGKYYVEGTEKLSNSFKRFNSINVVISSVLFMACLLLINPFVNLYTNGVNDADYHQPIFALIIVIANYVYCLREPFRLVILSAGKFKETNKGALIEAGLNVGISLLLVSFWGLIGIAIGTLIAIVYRFLYFIFYLKKDILFYSYRKYTEQIIRILVFISLNILIYFFVQINPSSYLSFFIHGIIVTLFELIATLIICLGAKKTIHCIKNIVNKTSKQRVL